MHSAFIEVGPSPTLTGMAMQTLKAIYEAKDDSTALSHMILCHASLEQCSRPQIVNMSNYHLVWPS